VGRLVYSYLASLDGYVEDAAGGFDWAVPSEEVHAFINDLERSVGTYLLGRRMYDTLAVWETEPALAEGSPVAGDFAAFMQAAEKVVYSTTLAAPRTRRTRIERTFDPDAVRELKAAAGADLSVGGADLAGQAIAAGLVDEVHLFVAPVVVGGGKRLFPDGLRVGLELLEQRSFGNGMVYLRYATMT